MTAAPVLLASARRRIIGDRPLVEFSYRDCEDLKNWMRDLSVRGQTVFVVGNNCDTCQFWFERLEPDVAPLDIDAMSGVLADGLRTFDEEVVGALAGILPDGDYHVALLRLTPERITPGTDADYFYNKQGADWPDFDERDFIHTATDYYRPAGRPEIAIAGEPGFDFLVPVQRPDSLDEDRIAYFEERLADGAAPTAVAVGLLDVKHTYPSDVPIGVSDISCSTAITRWRPRRGRGGP